MASPDITRRRSDPRALRAQVEGGVVTPGEKGWDLARQAYNLTIDQQPAAVAFPRDEEDVAAVIRFARRHGLRVAPQATGHNAGPLAPSLEDAVLLKTSSMKDVTIDAAARRARVGAGAKWEDVVPAASELGLAALHGSSPDVGIVGYSLGGGMGWQARKHGLQTHHVTAIELVLADGSLVRADRETDPELFWALRGGGGSFGVVTALEFELFELREVYAGALFFGLDRASEVMHAWTELTKTLPEEMTSVGRVLKFPPLEEVPEMVRGQAFAIVEAVHLGSEAEGADLLAPLRALGPAMDTFAMVPPVGLSELHMDPPDPVPYASATGNYERLPAEGVDRFVEHAADPASPLLGAELRHAGGALARREEGHGAAAPIPGELVMFAVGMVMDDESAAAVQVAGDALTAALAPWKAGVYPNFVEEPADPSRFFDELTWARLRAVKAEVDPDEVVLSNFPVPPAGRR